MGVKGLWTLLLPIGKRISIETLDGKRLAVDASIWIIQFVKAMRNDDETSNFQMKDGAHIIGFMRRLCKLIYHGIRPVIVFDGETPEIKREEIKKRLRKRKGGGYDRGGEVKRLARRILYEELKKMNREKKKVDENVSVNEEKILGNKDEKDTNPTFDLCSSGSESKYIEEVESSGSESKYIEEVETLPSNFKVDDILHMSSQKRSQNIGNTLKQYRLKKREEYLPVAGNPEAYANVQLKNFLKISKLKQNIIKAAKIVRGKEENENDILYNKNGLCEKMNDSADCNHNFERKTCDSGKDSSLTTSSVMQQSNYDQSEEGSFEEGGFIHDYSDENSMKDSSEIFDVPDDTSEPVKQQESNISKELSRCREILNTSVHTLNSSEELVNSNSENEIFPIQMMNEDSSEVIDVPDDISESVKWEEGNESNNLSTSDETVYLNSKNEFFPSTSSVIDVPDDSSESVKWEEGNDNKELSRCGDILNASINTLKSSDDIVSLNLECKILPCKIMNKDSSVIDPQDNTSASVEWEEGNDSKNLSTSDDIVNLSSNSEISSIEIVNKNALVDDILNNASESLEWKESNDTKYLSRCKENNEEESCKKQSMDTNTAAALKHAQLTAANLTNWAGRAVRRVLSDYESSNQQNEDRMKDLVTKEMKQIEDEDRMKDSIPKEMKQIERMNDDTMNFDEEESYIPQGRSLEEKIKHPMTKQMERTNGDTINLDEKEDPYIPQGKSLEEEAGYLRKSCIQEERNEDKMTEEMKDEIIELLDIFGIPFVIAPSEAEAQCVALENLGLVDGIITEDSDAFIFGAKAVYRNIFNTQKYVEVYLAKDAEKLLGLAKEEMVALAMILGGDYTEGVKGVGIVNGMEILSAFSMKDVGKGLELFNCWLHDDLQERKTIKGTKMTEEQLLFHFKHLKARARWIAPKYFPAPNVLQAYLKPVVDTSKVTFSWGKPCFESLLRFCYRKIGLSKDQTLQMIGPLMNHISRKQRTNQTRIDSFFMRYEDDIQFANVRSKRLKEIMQKQKIRQRPC